MSQLQTARTLRNETTCANGLLPSAITPLINATEASVAKSTALFKVCVTLTVTYRMSFDDILHRLQRQQQPYEKSFEGGFTVSPPFYLLIPS